MKVVASNCGCCGIKHIRDFPARPSDRIYVDWTEAGHDEEQSSSSPEPYQQWANNADIREGEQENIKSGEFFRKLVEQIKERRPSGMITLNLTSEPEHNSGYCCTSCNGMSRAKWNELHPQDAAVTWDEEQVMAWRPLFQEQGFDEVTFVNSNSDNRIHHFTLRYGE